MVFETVMQFKKMLKGLDAQLLKAAAYADQKKFDVEILTQSRLAPDMFPLVKQIQSVCDVAKFCAAYMSQQMPPKHEDNETTWKELHERIQKVLTYLDTFTPESFKNDTSLKVHPGWAKGKWMTGTDYVSEIAIPNFYFHCTMAYAILRHSGVGLGKMDYLGHIHLQEP